MTRTNPNLTAIILTLNEEVNLPACLESLKTLNPQIVVVDSLSTDRTVEIAESYGARVFKNKFEGYFQQRTFALRETGIQTEWILFLDADEKITDELGLEIKELILKNPIENGFKIKRRFIWNKKWVKRGYYPIWILRLARLKSVSCENRRLNEHLIVDGKVGFLKHDYIHEDYKGVDQWHIKHLKYAQLEALDFVNDKIQNVRFRSHPKRWIKYHVWNQLPLFLRPWAYFFLVYFIRGGFLDGWQGLSYHFFHSLWMQILVAHKVFELKSGSQKPPR